MTKLRLILALVGTLASIVPRIAVAQQHIALPPVNLGETSFMDGLGGPGWLTHAPVQLYNAPRFVGASGQTLSGNNTLVTLTELSHVGYTPPFKVLGGYLGFEVLLPVAFIEMTTPAGEASTTGIGDAILGPLVFQANVKLLGRPFYQRIDMDVVAPIGKYSRDGTVNVGSNVWSVNPYYAFTWLLSGRVETSWRIHYLWNSPNDEPGPGYEAATIQPGQAIHFNAAVSIAVAGPLRAGVAGYFLQQITDSKADGRPVPASRERVAALGPGLFATVGATQLIASAYWEFAVENRPVGARLNVSVLHAW